jgi:CheY-like chemotaxis protein
MNVLVIEDEPDVRELVGQCIKVRWPRTAITTADNGQQGLAILRGQPIDLLILDIGLPDIDGRQVLRRLREFSNLPVIMLTARRGEVDFERYLGDGALADDYIIKPFAQDDLLDRIAAVLERTLGRIDSPRQEPAPDAPDEHDPVYFGTVRLQVKAQGRFGMVVDFLQRLREMRDLRILRMTNDRTGGAEILLSLRQPTALHSLFLGLADVAEVRPAPAPESAAWESDPSLMVTLGPAPSS